ncbi:hypothetical protein F4805DRAFT_269744 [Annulohypoxylon moriforme]|nr:hypothetical protein F4805DRAFT_269744 [Annulohypoxylon moriforme]
MGYREIGILGGLLASWVAQSYCLHGVGVVVSRREGPFGFGRGSRVTHARNSKRKFRLLFWKMVNLPIGSF